MDTQKPASFGSAIVGFGIMAAALWVVTPLLDLLREGFGSPVAGKLFYEAIGRAFIGVLGLGAFAWVLEKVTGTKTAPPAQ